MRNRLIVLSMMLCFALPASAEVSVSVGIQTANIGISVSTYPNLVRVPDYPVYYAADVNSNYFFYDGMFWIFEGDRWYSSFWYNGPWILVEPEFIPVFLLRVPVRYYRRPPAYFIGWQASAPPRWDDHWGHDWARRRSGWDRWDRQSAPAPAPLPTYQRNYSGERYPSADQQAVLHERNYRYRPSDPLVRQQSEAATANQPDRTPRGKSEMPERRGAEPQAAPPSPAPAARESAPLDRQAPRSSPPLPRETNVRPPTVPPGPAPSAQEPVPVDRPAPHQPRAKERPEQQAQPMGGPRGEERAMPRGSPPAPREMRPQAEPNQQRMAPPREDRLPSGPGEAGQRHGRPGPQEKSDERGPERGR